MSSPAAVAEPMEQASCEAVAAVAEPKGIGEAVAAAERDALTVIGGGNVAAQDPRKGLVPAKRLR